MSYAAFEKNDTLYFNFKYNSFPVEQISSFRLHGTGPFTHFIASICQGGFSVLVYKNAIVFLENSDFFFEWTATLIPPEKSIFTEVGFKEINHLLHVEYTYIGKPPKLISLIDLRRGVFGEFTQV